MFPSKVNLTFPIVLFGSHEEVNTWMDWNPVNVPEVMRKKLSEQKVWKKNSFALGNTILRSHTRRLNLTMKHFKDKWEKKEKYFLWIIEEVIFLELQANILWMKSKQRPSWLKINLWQNYKFNLMILFERLWPNSTKYGRMNFDLPFCVKKRKPKCWELDFLKFCKESEREREREKERERYTRY